MDTKERILLESMRLFSIHGYEATTIRTIALAVGVGNSALYKHYRSKQEIFDAIVARCKNEFLENSSRILERTGDNLDRIKDFCMDMFRFQTQTESIVMFRRILLMEQFKNPAMQKVFHQFFVEMPVSGMEQIFSSLMKQGIMKSADSKTLATELYAPFYLHHLDADLCTEETYTLLRRHIDYFYEQWLVFPALMPEAAFE